jgi:hypothetical protein
MLIPVDYMYPQCLAFYPHDIHYWGNSGRLHWQAQWVYWFYTFVGGQVFKWLTAPVSLVLILTLLIDELFVSTGVLWKDGSILRKVPEESNSQKH